jgi:hypothetical protein
MTEDVIGELGAELGIDPERLAVLRGCSPTEQRAFADAVACTRHDQAAELDAALRRAVRMGAAVLPLLTALDEQHVAALGGVPELADPDTRAWLTRSTNLPPGVVDTVLDALRSGQPIP